MSLEELRLWLHDYEAVAIWLEGIALVLIFIWDRVDARATHRETIKQLKLSETAANAAKDSADIQAALHRPFMGLMRVLFSSISANEFRFEFTFKNYGTLPASGVEIDVDFFLDGGLRLQHKEIASVQIFPLETHQIVVRLPLGEDYFAVLHTEKVLQAKFTVRYSADDGRKFRYAADAVYEVDGFKTTKSETIEIRPASAPL